MTSGIPRAEPGSLRLTHSESEGKFERDPYYNLNLYYHLNHTVVLNLVVI